MKHKHVSIGLGVACVVGVGAVAWWGFVHRTSPGPLHSSHDLVPALQGNKGCDACHGSGEISKGKSMALACDVCHDEIGKQIAGATGLHGMMEFHDRNACEECHHEHIGDSVGLVSLAAFTSAGIQNEGAYDHKHVGGLQLEGKHLSLSCPACHTNADKVVLAENQLRYLGQTRDCATCHDDFHKGELGQDCAKCHGQEKAFKEAQLFKHPTTFELVKGHANLQCSQCHTVKGEFNGLSLACASCHTEQYERTSKPAHKVAGMNTDCAACHDIAKWDDAKYTHPAAFELLGAHKAAQCADCHSAGVRQEQVIAASKGGSCAACHMDAYDATKEPAHKVTKIKTDCASCHGVENWTSTSYKHPGSMQLVGAHLAAKCVDCHSQGERQAQVDRFATSKSCEACHASHHDAAFVRQARVVARASSDACQVCHAPADASWSEGTRRMTPVLHSATGFVLEKPHNTQKCEECHRLAGGVVVVGQSGIRTASEWHSVFPGRNAEACEACHDDPHNGQFATSAEGAACLRCHERAAFIPNKFGMDLHDRCSFPLDGSHKAVACAMCHRVERGVRTFAGVSHDCAACHDDVHKGKFDRAGMPRTVEGKAGCARCHTASDFQTVAWDANAHKMWTGESLTGKHALASCKDCHRRETITKTRPMAFAVAPRTCAECHADVHAGQFGDNGVTDCSKCHKSTDAFATLAFDHQRDSRFALDAEHVKHACNACHKAVDVAGTPVIRFKPLGVQCADCHDPRGVQGGPR